MRLLLFLLAFSACAQAAEVEVYRCVGAQGQTVYTDKPGANCTRQRMEIAPSAPATGLSEADKKLLEQADRRLVELDRATADIVKAFNALRAAEARRDQGVEPLEGERAGRRFRPEYWARQQALQRDVDSARATLDEALARRNALR